MKLANPVDGDTLVITQSPHGQYQNYQALDVVARNSSPNIYAVADGEITQIHNTLGHESYFTLQSVTFGTQYVHCIPTVRGHVKQGQIIGYMAQEKGWDYHCHIAVFTYNRWYPITNFLDRKYKLGLGQGFQHNFWKDWSFWEDIQLPLGFLNVNINSSNVLSNVNNNLTNVNSTLPINKPIMETTSTPVVTTTTTLPTTATITVDPSKDIVPSTIPYTLPMPSDGYTPVIIDDKTPTGHVISALKYLGPAAFLTAQIMPILDYYLNIPKSLHDPFSYLLIAVTNMALVYAVKKYGNLFV